jgi:hypothetical protein
VIHEPVPYIGCRDLNPAMARDAGSLGAAIARRGESLLAIPVQRENDAPAISKRTSEG